MRLPTKNNCPECSDQYRDYRRSQANRRSVHERIGSNRMDRCVKIDIHDRLGKKIADENLREHEHEEHKEYVWQKDQWCPGGLRRSQKRRVQRLRNREIEQTLKTKKTQVWRVKQTADAVRRSANIGMAFALPLEFKAPVNQEVCSDFDEYEYEELAAKLILNAQATFDKPVKYRHLKALYVKGLVDGKPMGKMLVDGGASVNLMPYTTFRKLGKIPDDLIHTDMRFWDFGGNLSETRGQSTSH